MNRRGFLFNSLAVLASAGVPGCITPRLFEPRGYTEEVSSVLISKDEKYLVVITNSYHYIFDAPPILVKAITGSFHKALTAEISYFYVHTFGKTTGSVDLNLRGATDESIQSALNAGFSKTSDGATTRVVLKGTRYEAAGVRPTEQYKLNKMYRVGVLAEQSSSEKVAKSLLTPITVAADGVLILFGVPLAILGLTIFCDKNCLK